MFKQSCGGFIQDKYGSASDADRPLLFLSKPNEICGISVGCAVRNLEQQTVQPTPCKPFCVFNECVRNKRKKELIGHPTYAIMS